MTVDWAVDTVVTRGHVMRHGGLVVDRVLDRVVDLGHGANVDDAPDLLMVTETDVMGGAAVNCVMSAVMGAVVMTSGAVGCDGGDKEGG